MSLSDPYRIPTFAAADLRLLSARTAARADRRRVAAATSNPAAAPRMPRRVIGGTVAAGIPPGEAARSAGAAPDAMVCRSLSVSNLAPNALQAPLSHAYTYQKF